MMPSLYGVVKNIKNVHPNRMVLVAGCTLTIAAMMIVPSMARAYGEELTNDGSFDQGSVYDQGNGLGGDYPAYSDGGYGGYPFDYYQDQANSDQQIPVLTQSDPQGEDTGAAVGDAPIDSNSLADTTDNPDTTSPSSSGQPAESSHAASEKPQAVATANATAKITVERVAPSSRYSMPAELPTTGPVASGIISGVGLAGLTAAAVYYANSRRELHRAVLKR